MSNSESPSSEGCEILDTPDGVPVFRFASLAAADTLVHAVSTRLGGTSSPPYDTLNLSWTSGDDPQAVEENHRRLCSTLGVLGSALVSPRQVHGANVRRVGSADRGTVIPDCDALVTDEPDVALLLRYADCVPILLFDGDHRAIGLAHAGWRGTVLGIATATVQRMELEFGTEPGKLVAALGPAIGPCCYTVGADVVKAVTNSLGDSDGLLRSNPAGARAAGQGAGMLLNLWEANRRTLEAAGVRNIEVCGICTACHNDRFFSYRAGNGQTGHHGALMVIRE